MQYHYICPKHAAEVQHNEVAAMELWQEFMSRGVRDYALCRWDNAYAFLGTAFEVAAIRSCNKRNTYFNGDNLLRPFEFMFEMLISDNDYHNAANHLVHTFNLIGLQNSYSIGQEVFELQCFSVKLKEKVMESTMSVEDKNHLMTLCDDICFFGEKKQMH